MVSHAEHATRYNAEKGQIMKTTTPEATTATNAERFTLHISDGNSKMGKVPSVSLLPGCTCAPGAPCFTSGECYALALKRYPTVWNAYSENKNFPTLKNFFRKVLTSVI